MVIPIMQTPRALVGVKASEGGKVAAGVAWALFVEEAEVFMLRDEEEEGNGFSRSISVSSSAARGRLSKAEQGSTGGGVGCIMLARTSCFC